MRFFTHSSIRQKNNYGYWAVALGAAAFASYFIYNQFYSSRKIFNDPRKMPVQLFKPKEQKPNRGLMVLIEGLDLAGKSTLTRQLIEVLEKKNFRARFSRNAITRENPIAKVADDFRKEAKAGLLETGALFLAAHQYDALKFKEPDKNTIHIQDSCWLRTLAFHSGHHTRFIPQLIYQTHQDQPHFDVVIYLTASIEARKIRVLKREQESNQNDAADYWAYTDPEKVQKLDKILCEKTKELYPDSYCIDTSNLTPEKVLEKTLHILKNHLSELDITRENLCRASI